nr:hypothetical protein GCM10025732_46020 [Glycomyces mayteni]
MQSLQALAHARLGDREAAARLAGAAAEAAVATSSPELALEVLNNAGFAYGAVGDVTAAERAHRDALDLAEAVPDLYEQARARHGIGDALAARGEDDAARAEWTRALRLHEKLGTYGRAELAERLA